MRTIIECDPEHFPRALALLAAEAADFAKYDKVGWGWSFGGAGWGVRFFVRRIKHGLSVKQLRERAPTPGDKG